MGRGGVTTSNVKITYKQRAVLRRGFRGAFGCDIRDPPRDNPSLNPFVSPIRLQVGLIQQFWNSYYS